MVSVGIRSPSLTIAWAVEPLLVDDVSLTQRGVSTTLCGPLQGVGPPIAPHSDSITSIRDRLYPCLPPFPPVGLSIHSFIHSISFQTPIITATNVQYRMVQARSRPPLVVLAAAVLALMISSTMLLPRASAFLMQPRAAALAATAGRKALRMGLDQSSRPAPRGHKFRRFSSSGGSSSDDFAAINPQTLNWEKVGPEEDVFISALSQNGHVNVKVLTYPFVCLSIPELDEARDAHHCRPSHPPHLNVSRNQVVSAKNLVEGMRKKRELGAVATETMGRVMLSAMLVAHGVKVGETSCIADVGSCLVGINGCRGIASASAGAHAPLNTAHPTSTPIDRPP